MFALLTQLNTYVNTTCIWEICNEKYPDDTRTEDQRQEIVRTLWESMYIVAHFLYPIIPDTSAKLLALMDEPHRHLPDLAWGVLEPGKEIRKQDTKLFAILDTDAAAKRKNKNIEKKK